MGSEKQGKGKSGKESTAVKNRGANCKSRPTTGGNETDRNRASGRKRKIFLLLQNRGNRTHRQRQACCERETVRKRRAIRERESNRPGRKNRFSKKAAVAAPSGKQRQKREERKKASFQERSTREYLYGQESFSRQQKI